METEPVVSGQPERTKSWAVGTLRYTKGGLVVLFFWLIWNDFFLALMETVKPTLTGLLMKDHGASNMEIALYMSTLSAILTSWINPVVSTWSDRTRTKWGRRRPFLLMATPPAAVCLALIPWAPRIWAWLMHFEWFAVSLGAVPINGPVLAIGVCTILFSFFNAVLLAIFTYFFWDVVPEPVLGRFNAISKIVTTIKTFIWNYWLFGLAESYMEWIYGGIAFLFLVVYMISILVIKEGEYPPPDEHKKGGKIFAPIRAYFVECFGNSYYLWIFAAFIFYQLGNLAVIYRIFHWRDTLGMGLDTIGKMQAWPSAAIVLLGFPLGAMVDRLNPMRVIAPSLLIWGTVNVACFFFLKGPTSLLIMLTAIALAQFIFSVCVGVLTIEVFPREKIGQFCSANAICQQVFCLIVGPLLGLLLDHLKDYSYVYLWSAIFQFLAAGLFIKVYLNWLRLKKNPPLPHAG